MPDGAVGKQAGAANGSLAWSGTEIPSLYGLRGLAAMAVVLGHLGLDAFSPTYAVICFFVLSGFLITHLLLREYDKAGKIRLGRFYLRRVLRIFPAFYGYAVCYVLGRLVIGLPIDWASVVSCLTYTSNYYFAFSGHPLATMIHTWSLAVEEQFYLLWPFVVWRMAANRRLLIKVLVGTILTVWTYRWVTVLLSFNGTYVFSSFETRADALAIGCLIAVANREECLPRQLINWKWLTPAAFVLVAVSSVLDWNGPRYGWSIVALGFGVVLIQSIAHARTHWYSFLETRPFRALGLISYSLYLYHPFSNRLPKALHYLPVEVLFAVALASGSYWIVEKPFLRLKDRVGKSVALGA